MLVEISLAWKLPKWILCVKLMFDRYGRHSFNQKAALSNKRAACKIKNELKILHLSIFPDRRCHESIFGTGRSHCLSTAPVFDAQYEATWAPCSLGRKHEGMRRLNQSNWWAQNAVGVRLSKAPLLVKFSLCACGCVFSHPANHTERNVLLQVNSAAGSLIAGSYEWVRGQAPCSPGYSRLAGSSLPRVRTWLTDRWERSGGTAK